MALLCFLFSQASAFVYRFTIFSLKPNTVVSKNRFSLSAYNLSSSHVRAAIVKAAASGVDRAEPESNDEPPKTVVDVVPVDKLPLESKEAKEKLLLEQRMKMKLANKIRLRRKRLRKKLKNV